MINKMYTIKSLLCIDSGGSTNITAGKLYQQVSDTYFLSGRIRVNVIGDRGAVEKGYYYHRFKPVKCSEKLRDFK